MYQSLFPFTELICSAINTHEMYSKLSNLLVVEAAMIPEHD